MPRRNSLNERLEKIREKKAKPKYKVIDFPNLRSYEPPYSLSDRIDGLCAKQDKLTGHLWKKGKTEKPETVKEMNTKAKRIRPLYSKGAGQYATDGDNTGPIRIHQKGG